MCPFLLWMVHFWPLTTWLKYYYRSKLFTKHMCLLCIRTQITILNCSQTHYGTSKQRFALSDIDFWHTYLSTSIHWFKSFTTLCLLVCFCGWRSYVSTQSMGNVCHVNHPSWLRTQLFSAAVLCLVLIGPCGKPQTAERSAHGARWGKSLNGKLDVDRVFR